MISLGRVWDALRTKKRSLLSVETNKVSNFLRARRVEHTAATGHPSLLGYVWSIFPPRAFSRQRNKMFKSSGRRLSQLPSCIARCYCCCYCCCDDESRGEKLLAFPWSSLAIQLRVSNISRDHSLPARSLDDNKNENESTMTMINPWCRVWTRVTKRSIGISVGIEEDERNTAAAVIKSTRAQAGREVRFARQWGCEHVNADMRRLSDISFFSLTRGDAASSALTMVVSRRVLATDTYGSAFVKLVLDRPNGQDDSLSPPIDLWMISQPKPVGNWMMTVLSSPTFLLDQRMAH